MVAVVQVLLSSLQAVSSEEQVAWVSQPMYYYGHSRQVEEVDQGELVVLVAVVEVQACSHRLRDMQKVPSLVVRRVAV